MQLYLNDFCVLDVPSITVCTVAVVRLIAFSGTRPAVVV